MTDTRALARQERQQEALEALREGRGIPVLAPVLDDPREADFIEEYVRHNDPVKAIERSGIRGEGRDVSLSFSALADRLLAKPSVQVGVEFLRRARAYWGAGGGAGGITRESLVASLEDIAEDARRSRKHSEAIQAKKLQAQLMGLLIERREVTFKKKIEDMTDAELMELAAKRKRATAAERVIEVEAEVLPPLQ